jgi:hypothetical protein
MRNCAAQDCRFVASGDLVAEQIDVDVAPFRHRRRSRWPVRRSDFL